MHSFNKKPSTISFNYNNVWPATNRQDENLDFFVARTSSATEY